MSLHNAAKHIAAQGRGPDTQLVHMAPSEVHGLQAIAKAHGGSLTINPHTGLAEAGFLKNILPTVLGAALAATGVGAPMAALMVGGGYGLAKGDLKAGLLAGLGAYGGAGLAGGAMGLGSNAGTTAATTEATAAGEAAAQQAGQDYAAQQAATNAAGQTAVTPQAIEQVAQQQAQSAAIPQSAWEQSAREFAADTAGTSAAPFSQATQNTMAQSQFSAGLDKAIQNPSAYIDKVGGGAQAAKYGLAAAAPGIADSMKPAPLPEPEKYDGPLSRFKFNPETYQAYDPTPPNPYYQAQYQDYRGYAGGGTVEQMSNANAIGMNTGYPQADVQGHAYASPWQTPMSQNMVTDAADTGVNRMTGEMNFAAGGHLGSYSDGGRMLKGPGDGMSDSIPAKIGAKQPARLADGEFVVPADVVSHLGNGSSDAGAKQLYKMMDRIRAARTGKKKQAPQVNPSKAMPA